MTTHSEDSGPSTYRPDTAPISGEPVSEEPDTVHSPFVPLMVLASAFAIWAAFETGQLIIEQRNLSALRESQETAMQNSQKLRVALDRLVRETTKLADEGNPNAKLLVEELRKHGVTLSAGAPEQKK
jgi:ABC-type transporter Mla subunit MlaD